MDFDAGISLSVTEGPSSLSPSLDQGTVFILLFFLFFFYGLRIITVAKSIIGVWCTKVLLCVLVREKGRIMQEVVFIARIAV